MGLSGPIIFLLSRYVKRKIEREREEEKEKETQGKTVFTVSAFKRPNPSRCVSGIGIAIRNLEISIYFPIPSGKQT